MNLVDVLRHSTRLHGNKIAITSPEGQMTYDQFKTACKSLGQVLYGLDLNRGDRVAMLDFNSLEYCVVHFGVPCCGMVAVPLNHRLAAPELVGILTDARVSALIYSPAFTNVVERIRPELPFTSHFICTRLKGDDNDLTSLMENARGAFTMPEPKVVDLAHLLYTSGTTGRPKGVMLSHANSTTTIASLLVEWELTAEDVGLMVAPLFHVAACHSFMALVARGCTIHILPGFDAPKTLNAIQETKSTFCLLVPAMIAALLNAPGQENIDITSLSTVIYAGAPMPEELLKASLNRFGNVFLQIYGLTETSALTCLTREDHKDPRYLSSAGRQIFGTEVMVVDEGGKETAPDKIGQVIARGENVTTGYWNAPEETAAALKDGCFYTGDMALRDEAGYIFLKDRKKDLIVTGGENVYPIEVESILHQIPAVQEAAVIGVPDPKWGEKVLALVNLRPNQQITAEEIIAFCHERLAGYKCPKTVEFTGPLPRTSAGKIQKNVLRDSYWKGQVRDIN